MNRVSKRASSILLLVLLLTGGLGFFVYEYFTKAETWIVSSGSPHIYNSSNIGCGQVTDRSGELLLDITAKRAYSDDLSVRMSTLHLLGDRQGRISAPAIAHYGKEMTGYDLVDGLYSYDGSAGEAVLTVSAEEAEYDLVYPVYGGNHRHLQLPNRRDPLCGHHTYL